MQRLEAKRSTLKGRGLTLYSLDQESRRQAWSPRSSPVRWDRGAGSGGREQQTLLRMDVPHGPDLSVGGDFVTPIKMAGIALVAAGILGLAYGGFSYTKDTSEARIGSVELSLKEKHKVNIPVWAGVGALVVGGFLLVAPRRAS